MPQLVSLKPAPPAHFLLQRDNNSSQVKSSQVKSSQVNIIVTVEVFVGQGRGAATMAGDILDRPFVPLEPAALQAENERLKAEVLVLREQL